jgi:quercetin dioxygenase-like cupin family protein
VREFPHLRASRPMLAFARLAAGAAVGALALTALPARTLALANTETEEERMSRVLQSALEKHGADVNRCFEKALADTLDVSGKVELSVDVGDEGKVTRVVALDGAATSPVLIDCLQESTATWSLAGVAPGSTVIVPLAFEGQSAQFSLKVADAPERGPGAPGKGKAKARPGAMPTFSVKVLVDEATMRARQASLSLLTIAPANRIAMHRHPGAELLFVKKGRARVLGPSGIAPELLAEGSAVYIPPGMPHVIENMVRSAPVEILQSFIPLGPERVYRDPTDEKGRAAFEVIRDPRKAVVPAGEKLVVASADKVAPRSLAGGQIKARVLFDQASTESRAGVSLVEFSPGAKIARHTHEGSAEIIYVLSGGGEVEIGSEKIPFGPDQVIHIPENQPHAVKFHGSDKTVALQIFAPAGPEAKYKGEKGDPGTR